MNRSLFTFEGYQTALVDSLGSSGYNIAKSQKLNRLLFSFHMDRPKSVILCGGQWEKVSLLPSYDFSAKDQLVWKGAQSVSSVIIPALATIVDGSLKENRTLYPVHAPRFYLDCTQD